MKKVIVVGAGSSGLVAAICAARRGASVTVLEHMNKPGRKLLLTGSGKCNLTTLDPDYTARYQSTADAAATKQFVESVFQKYSNQDTLSFFEEIGLMTRNKGVYVYPSSEQSASVLSVLLREAERLGVRFKYNTHVKSLFYQKETGSWEVKVEGWQYQCDCVILCCGSKASPATGSDGSGYEIVSGLKEKLTEIVPALTACICQDPNLTLAAGARTHASVTLIAPGYRSETQVGEIQWNKDGISGIAVFQLSGRAARMLKKKESVSLLIDFFPEQVEADLAAFLNRQRERFPKNDLQDLLFGMLPDRILHYLAKSTSIKKCNDMKAAARLLKSFSIPVQDVRDYTQSQTCSGGVAISGIDPATMESRRYPGLYYAGELIDIDGPCGGYNLQWAFSSAMMAGSRAGTE